MSYQGLKIATATAALMIGLLAHTGAADAQAQAGGFRGGGDSEAAVSVAADGAAADCGGGWRGAQFGGWRGGVVGWRGGGWGGVLGGGWGGRHWGGGWGGWGGRHVGYYRPWRRAYWGGWPWYGAGLAGAGLGYGWPYYSNVGYYGGDSCYRLRRVWTNWGWRRQWVNVCDGWGYGERLRRMGRIRRMGRRMGLGLVSPAFPRSVTTSALPVREGVFAFARQPWRSGCGAADND